MMIGRGRGRGGPRRRSEGVVGRGSRRAMGQTSDYLALDLGAESGRGLLGRFDGERLTLEEVHRFPNGPVRLLETIYWDLPRLADECKAALRKAASGRRL